MIELIDTVEKFGAWNMYSMRTISLDIFPEDAPPEIDMDTINADSFWYYREDLRFGREYKKPRCWEALCEAGAVIPHHFLHISTENPAHVAYTPSHAYGLRDRQVHMGLGRYLAKFCDDQLTQEQIRDLVNTNIPQAINWARTGAEMERVYTNGPTGSCMTVCSSDPHPAHCYDYTYPDGSKEFALAYLGPEDAVTARALVALKENFYVRAYGTDGPILESLLQGSGTEKRDGWDGLRIRAMWENGNLICPFIDGTQQGVLVRESFLQICDEGEGEYAATNQNGYANETDEEDLSQCGYCDAGIPEDDVRYSETCEIWLCEACIERHYTSAIYNKHTDTTYVQNDNVIYCESDRTHYLNAPVILEHYDVIYCEDVGKYYDREDTILTIDDEFIRCTHGYITCDGDESVYAECSSVTSEWKWDSDKEYWLHPNFFCGCDYSNPYLISAGEFFSTQLFSKSQYPQGQALAEKFEQEQEQEEREPVVWTLRPVYDSTAEREQLEEVAA